MEIPEYYPFRSAETRTRYLELYDQWARLWPVVAETQTVETAYGTTFVRISGSPAAPPLVLLPGGGSHSLMWIPHIAAWAARYRVYALDSIYDYGRSAAKRPLNRISDLTQWLDSVLTELRLKGEVNLGGMSLGGWLAGQYALRYPRRLRKLVLIAPAGTVLPVSWKWLIRMLSVMIPHPSFFRNFIYWTSTDLRRNPDGQAMADRMIEQFNMTRECFRPMPMVAPSVMTDAELAGISVPTLYMVGENEKVCSAAEAVARLRRVAPQIHIEVVPQAGHDLLAVQTETVNQRVLAFLDPA